MNNLTVIDINNNHNKMFCGSSKPILKREENKMQSRNYEVCFENNYDAHTQIKIVNAMIETLRKKAIEEYNGNKISVIVRDGFFELIRSLEDLCVVICKYMLSEHFSKLYKLLTPSKMDKISRRYLMKCLQYEPGHLPANIEEAIIMEDV